jgi:hypothetical protein
MNRPLRIPLLATILALAVAGSGAAYAQPAVAQPAKFDGITQCAIEKHPNEARWFGALLAKRVSIDPEVRAGAFLNATGELLKGCLVDGSHWDFDAFVASLQRYGESAPTGPPRPGPMDALGDCLQRFAPQEAVAFLRESDIGAARSFNSSQPGADGKLSLRMGYLSDPALDAMISKSLLGKPGCGPVIKKLGKRVQRVDANALYSRINWLLRAEPQLGSGK